VIFDPQQWGWNTGEIEREREKQVHFSCRRLCRKVTKYGVHIQWLTVSLSVYELFKCPLPSYTSAFTSLVKSSKLNRKKCTSAILDFRNLQILLYDGVPWAKMHHCAKFYQNQSSHCWDIAILRLSRWQLSAICTQHTTILLLSAILDFLNLEISLADGVQTTDIHQHAEFHQNQCVAKIWYFF